MGENPVHQCTELPWTLSWLILPYSEPKITRKTPLRRRLKTKITPPCLSPLVRWADLVQWWPRGICLQMTGGWAFDSRNMSHTIRFCPSKLKCSAVSLSTYRCLKFKARTWQESETRQKVLQIYSWKLYVLKLSRQKPNYNFISSSQGWFHSGRTWIINFLKLATGREKSLIFGTDSGGRNSSSHTGVPKQLAPRDQLPMVALIPAQK